MTVISKILNLKIFRFLSVGAIATLLHSAIYAALVVFELSPQYANLIGYCIAFLFSFIGQTYFTFKTKTSVSNSYKFFVVSIFGYFINSFWVWMTEYINYDALFAVFPIIVLTPIFTFLLLENWVYKKREVI